MLAEAFVSAGCTYCDKDDIHEFLSEKQPNLLVVRRSLPHAGEWPDIHKLYKDILIKNYGIKVLCITREYHSAKRSVLRRKDAYVCFEFEEAFKKAGEYVESLGGYVVSYEYFVLSSGYRKYLFEAVMDLPAPKMEFYDGNAKYYK